MVGLWVRMFWLSKYEPACNVAKYWGDGWRNEIGLVDSGIDPQKCIMVAEPEAKWAIGYKRRI